MPRLQLFFFLLSSQLGNSSFLVHQSWITWPFWIFQSSIGELLPPPLLLLPSLDPLPHQKHYCVCKDRMGWRLQMQDRELKESDNKWSEIPCRLVYIFVLLAFPKEKGGWGRRTSQFKYLLLNTLIHRGKVLACSHWISNDLVSVTTIFPSLGTVPVTIYAQ